MSEEEARWIAAARAGDARAFRQLVEAHARRIHAVCWRILGDSALAEDAVQETFINAWRGLARFDGRAGFATWLHRIAVNAALGMRRAAHPMASLDLDDATPDEAAVDGHWGGLSAALDPQRSAAAGEARAHVERGLAALTVMERTAFVLRHVEQYALEEIARTLGINVNACKQAVFRAVRKLRPVLEPLRSTP